MDFRYVAPALPSLDELSTEVVCCALWEDERPAQGLAGLLDWRLAGRLSALLEAGFALGAPDEIVMVPGRPQLPFEKVLLLGLGKKTDFGEEAARRALRRLLGTLEGLGVRRAVVELPGRADGSMPAGRAAELARACAEGSAMHDTWWLVEGAEGAAAAAGKARKA